MSKEMDSAQLIAQEEEINLLRKQVEQLEAENKRLREAGVSPVLSTAVLGTAVIVRGQVVAWFVDFTEDARDWCTENHFGEWLTWQANPPEIVPLTEAEYAEAMRSGAELAALLEAMPEAPN